MATKKKSLKKHLRKAKEKKRQRMAEGGVEEKKLTQNAQQIMFGTGAGIHPVDKKEK